MTASDSERLLRCTGGLIEFAASLYGLAVTASALRRVTQRHKEYGCTPCGAEGPGKASVPGLTLGTGETTPCCSLFPHRPTRFMEVLAHVPSPMGC